MRKLDLLLKVVALGHCSCSQVLRALHLQRAAEIPWLDWHRHTVRSLSTLADNYYEPDSCTTGEPKPTSFKCSARLLTAAECWEGLGPMLPLLRLQDIWGVLGSSCTADCLVAGTPTVPKAMRMRSSCRHSHCTVAAWTESLNWVMRTAFPDKVMLDAAECLTNTRQTGMQGGFWAHEMSRGRFPWPETASASRATLKQSAL